MGRQRTGIVLSSDLDVFGVAPVDQFLAGRDGHERFQQVGLMGLEGGDGRPGFRGPGAGKMGDDGAGSEPILHGRSERLVGPLLAGRDDTHGVVFSTGLGDGGRVAETTAEDLGVLRREEGKG